MKYLKLYEKYTGKFLSEYEFKPNSDIKIDRQMIHDRLKIGDWIEYYFNDYDYHENKNIWTKEEGCIIEKDDTTSDFDILVKIDPNSDKKGDIYHRWIESNLINRKLTEEEIDVKKYNL